MQICKSHLQLPIHLLISPQSHNCFTTALNVCVPVVIGDGKRKSAVEGSPAQQDRMNPLGIRKGLLPWLHVSSGLEWSQNVQ